MNPAEEASFRKLYSSWPTARLARASTLEKDDYRPDVLPLMLEELAKRGVTAAALPEVVASSGPPLQGDLPVRDTWLFPARLARRRYVISTLVFVVLVITAAVFLELFPAAQPASFVALMLASLIYGALGLLLPRAKDAGFSSWLAVVFGLFPITAFFAFVFLFFVPSGQKKR